MASGTQTQTVTNRAIQMTENITIKTGYNIKTPIMPTNMSLKI